MESTKIFVASYINNYLGERGLLGSVEPDDLDEISRWLDYSALDEIRIALIDLRANSAARKGHDLAGKLLRDIRAALRAIQPTEQSRRKNKMAYRRQHYRPVRQFQAAI